MCLRFIPHLSPICLSLSLSLGQHHGLERLAVVDGAIVQKETRKGRGVVRLGHPVSRSRDYFNGELPQNITGRGEQ